MTIFLPFAFPCKFISFAKWGNPHWGSVVRHQPLRADTCVVLVATQTAVYSAVPGAAEPGLQLRLRQLFGQHLSAPTLHNFPYHARQLTDSFRAEPFSSRRLKTKIFGLGFSNTRVMGLSSSEDPMIVAGVVLAWYQRVTDGRTDGQTDRIYHS